MIQLFTYRAKVLKIVDGDTVDLEVDRGFRDKFTDRFRLAWINAPERNEAAGSAATAWLADQLPLGAEIIIRTSHPKVRDPRDSFGRWIAAIYPAVGEDLEPARSVNMAMVEAGHAVLKQY